MNKNTSHESYLKLSHVPLYWKPSFTELSFKETKLILRAYGQFRLGEPPVTDRVKLSLGYRVITRSLFLTILSPGVPTTQLVNLEG